jgi:hypothetical protein
MRIVEGLRGRVPMQMELSLRPDSESIRPWVEPADRVTDSAGPHAFRLRTPLPLRVEDGSVKGEFAAVEGARERLTLPGISPMRRLRRSGTATRRLPQGGNGGGAGGTRARIATRW